MYRKNMKKSSYPLQGMILGNPMTDHESSGKQNGTNSCLIPAIHVS